MPNGKKVRLDDIAKECGVTKGLVSRALAGKYNVGDETRNEIMKKAVELGYDFSRLRVKNKPKTSVVLIVSTSVLMKEDFWQPIIKNLYATLNRSSINLEYFVFDADRIDVQKLRELKNNPCIAFIILHVNPDAVVKELKNFGKPIIEVDPKYMHPAGVTQIKFSNYTSMYEVTQRLIDYGHKCLCFYGSDSHSMSFRERREGFAACIDSVKDKKIRGIIINFDNSDLQYSDNELLRSTLEKNKDITAIVCANDIIALNVYKVLDKMGKRVPEDYSIIGFDNVKIGEYARPPLSTFNVPREQIGDEIGHYILRLTQEDKPQYSEFIIRSEFIERSSIRAIGKNNE
ncbi:MAG: LacI family DNA-binding transcriptional regulator [Bacilli bacterium]|nr:LacI family DNA-binding transcriptional regulator [Bacilli bacterium]